MIPQLTTQRQGSHRFLALSFPFLSSTRPLSCPPNETDQHQDYPAAGPVSTSLLLSISQGRVTSDAWQPGGLFVTVERSTPGQY